MSGPKVIRIVTREELIALCQAQTAALDAATAHWRKRTGAPEQVVEEIAARRARLEAMLAEDRFVDYQRAAIAEGIFLEDDAERRIEEQAQALARAKGTRRRVADAAKSILARLADHGDAPAELVEQLQAIANGDEQANGMTLSEAFNFLATTSAPTEPELTSEQQNFLRSSATGNIRGLEDWLADQPEPLADWAQKIDARIARLEVEFGASAAEAFATRWTAILSEPDPSKARMQADSLLLDISADATRRQLATSRVAEAAQLLARLRSFAASAPDEIEVAVTEGVVSDQTLETLREVLAKAEAERRVALNREVLLRELKELGYEVREGMQTALAEQDRLVLRTPHARDYGVEVQKAGERYQIRALRFSDRADRQRDLEIEQKWCSDFATLRAAVAADGGEVPIDQALPVGATPLKVEVSQSARPANRQELRH